MALDAGTIQAIADANAQAMRSYFGSAGAIRGPTAGAGGGLNIGANLEGAFASAVGGFAKVATGTADVTDVMKIMTSALANVPVAGRSVALVFNTLGQGVLNANNSMNELGKSGVTFGNNLGLMNMATSGARITIEQFQDMMKQGASSISSLGGNADRGATTFLELSTKLQETKIIQDLVESGVSTKELNDLTLITMMNRRRLDVDDDRQKAAAIESTSKLAQEMDLIARLTGKSREEQQRDLKAGLMKAEVQATLNQLDDEARINYMNMRTAVGPLGQNIQDLADEIVTGGVRTQEGSARLAALGTAGAAFEAALKQQMAARDPIERAAADAALMKAKADITAYQASKEFTSQIQFDTTIVGQMAKQQQNQNVQAQAEAGRRNEIDKVIIAERAAGREKIDRASAAVKVEENLRVKAKLAQEGELLEGGKENAKVARAINAANAAIKDQTAGLGKQFDELNKKAGDYLISQDKIVQYFNGVISRQTQTQAAANQANTVQRLIDTGKVSNAAQPVKPDDEFNPSRSTGSLGSVGKFIEDFGAGTLAMLHGKEGVVTEDQLKGLVSETFNLGQASFNPKSMVSAMLEQLSGSVQTQAGADAVAQQSAATPAAQAQVIIPPAMNDLSQGIIQLNMRMERLIAAVEDGADKTARAAKSKGNLLA